jgi:hypothetical protein
MYGSPSLAIPAPIATPIREGGFTLYAGPPFLTPLQTPEGTTFLGKTKSKVSKLQIGGNVGNGIHHRARGNPEIRKQGKLGKAWY